MHKKTICVIVQALSDHEQRNVFLSMTTGEGIHGLDQDCEELNSGSGYISAITVKRRRRHQRTHFAEPQRSSPEVWEIVRLAVTYSKTPQDSDCKGTVRVLSTPIQ